MIGALLSNTPVSLLRNSGVAGELAPGADNSVQNREPSTARDSQASPRADAINAQKTPILTSQAVLALQDAERSDASARRQRQADQSGQSSSETSGTDTEQADAPAGQQAGRASANNSNQSPTNSSGVQQSSKEDDADGDGLNEAEEKQVEKLKQRDREVKAHEQAHARVGGAYASAPTYTFQQGPDGKRYAVGGEVQIDTSTERTPEATIRKMRVVISAALAPAEPSGQDLSVAQQARSQLSEAQAELRQKKLEELQGDDDETGGIERTEQPSDNGSSSSEGPNTSVSAEDAGPSDNVNDGETNESARTVADRAAIDVYQDAIARAAEQQASAQSLFA